MIFKPFGPYVYRLLVAGFTLISKRRDKVRSFHFVDIPVYSVLMLSANLKDKLKRRTQKGSSQKKKPKKSQRKGG